MDIIRQKINNILRDWKYEAISTTQAIDSILACSNETSRALTEEDINVFREEHKMKTGHDYRLEVLKMSKENIHDFLCHKYQDYIHGWRILVQESEAKTRNLENKIKQLESELCSNCKERIIQDKK